MWCTRIFWTVGLFLINNKVTAQKIFDALKSYVEEKHGIHHAIWWALECMITHDFAVSIVLSFEYKQNAESISVYIGRHMYAFKDKPIVAWSDRPRQRVYESDLRANYYLLKPYLLVCGNKTPLPDLVHHEVCGFHDVRMYRFKISILNNYIYIWITTSNFRRLLCSSVALTTSMQHSMAAEEDEDCWESLASNYIASVDPIKFIWLIMIELSCQISILN